MPQLTYAVLQGTDPPVLESKEMTGTFDDFVGMVGFPIVLVPARTERLEDAVMLVGLEMYDQSTPPEANRLASTLAGKEIRGRAVLLGQQGVNQRLTSLPPEWIDKMLVLQGRATTPEASQ